MFCRSLLLGKEEQQTIHHDVYMFLVAVQSPLLVES